MLRVAEHSERTDTGRQRDINEDAFFARSPLFAVADGVGGAQAGEVASGIAVEVLDGGLPDGAGTVEARLAGLVREANRRVYERATSDEALSGMGSTLTAAYLGEEELTVAHVGDSRAYRWREGRLELLTQDHSLVGEFVRQGRLTESEAAAHPHRNVITRALGSGPEVEVDTHTWRAQDGDVYLLCSDGLAPTIRDEELQRILGAGTPLPATVRALVDAANAAGGPDNITAVLFRVEGVGAPADGDPATGALGATTVGSAAPRTEDVRRALAEREAAAAEAEARRRVPRAPAQNAAPARRRRVGPGVRRALKIAAVLAVFAGMVLIGGYFASQTVYFVGTNQDGFVTLYRGLPYELPGGLRLYTENFVSGVNAQQLPPGRRSALLDERLRSRNDAVDLVRQVEQGTITAR